MLFSFAGGNYKLLIDAKTLVYPLALAWKNSKNVDDILKLWKAIYQMNQSNNSHLLGHVLTDLLKMSSTQEELNGFLKILEV